MCCIIVDYMVNFKKILLYVIFFVEVDVIKIVNWCNKVKKQFQEKYGEKIIFILIFMEAVVKVIWDFLMVNVLVDGNIIVCKKNVNIGMVMVLFFGNLIVFVIKNVDYFNLMGFIRQVNGLVVCVWVNKLGVDEIQGGIFILINVGIFGNVMGMLIINQF